MYDKFDTLKGIFRKPQEITELNTECVEDFPRPPRLEPVPHVLRVELLGQCVAETSNGLRILETYHAPTYYFPPEDVFAEFAQICGRTFCEWKGVATFFDVSLGEVTAPRAAWSYQHPCGEFLDLRNYVAFYPNSMSACYVDLVRVTPQPGRYYGGWVTPNLTGRIKGAPGTSHW